jgi:hypothetical protein
LGLALTTTNRFFRVISIHTYAHVDPDCIESVHTIFLGYLTRCCWIKQPSSSERPLDARSTVHSDQQEIGRIEPMGNVVTNRKLENTPVPWHVQQISAQSKKNQEQHCCLCIMPSLNGRHEVSLTLGAKHKKGYRFIVTLRPTSQPSRSRRRRIEGPNRSHFVKLSKTLSSEKLVGSSVGNRITLTTNYSAHARVSEAAVRGNLSGEECNISKSIHFEDGQSFQRTKVVRLPKRAETHRLRRLATDGLRIPDCVVFDDVKEMGQVAQSSLVGWEEDRSFLICYLC